MIKSELACALDWLSRPHPGHLVHFYTHKSALIANLEEYIGDGLVAGDNCVVIATKTHTRRLDEALSSRIDVNSAKQSGQYLTLDAKETLASFMVDGLPDPELFNRHVGNLIHKFTDKGRKVRAYGEMVAVLWKEGNKYGVIELEQLWNKLGDDHQFALYCAYPDLHFIMDSAVKEEIRGFHNLGSPSFMAEV